MAMTSSERTHMSTTPTTTAATPRTKTARRTTTRTTSTILITTTTTQQQQQQQQKQQQTTAASKIARTARTATRPPLFGHARRCGVLKHTVVHLYPSFGLHTNLDGYMRAPQPCITCRSISHVGQNNNINTA